MTCMKRKNRSKDVKSMSVCTYRKGNNNDNKNERYEIIKHSRDRKERDLHPKVLCTRQHVVVLAKDSLFLLWKLMRVWYQNGCW